MTSSHEQKTACFVPSVTSLLRVLFFHRFGRSWVQNIGFADTFWTLFFWISAGNGRIWRKSKKEIFWVDKNKQTWLFLLHAHRSLWRFLRVLLFFFLIIDMSVMCLSLVTKCVRLNGKELHFFENWWFFLNRTIWRAWLFLHMLCCSVSITQAFKVCSMHGMQYHAPKRTVIYFVAMNTLSIYLLRKNNFSKEAENLKNMIKNLNKSSTIITLYYIYSYTILLCFIFSMYKNLLSLTRPWIQNNLHDLMTILINIRWFLLLISAVSKNKFLLCFSCN